MIQLATSVPIAADLGFEASDPLYEVVNGQMREIAPMGAYEGAIASALLISLGSFAFENKLGWAVSEVLFVIDAVRGRQRRPDVAFVSYNRWPDAEIPSDNAWNVVPNLAVEIVSPTNLATEIEVKIVEYFDAGVDLVWVIHPRLKRVYVYNSRDKCEVQEHGGELSGGDVIRGFRLPMAKLFETLAKPQG